MQTYERVPQQLHQQPSRPLHNAYDSGIGMRAAGNSRFSYEYSDRLEENWTKAEEGNSYTHEDDSDDDSPHMLKGLLTKLDVKGHERFQKLVSRVEKDLPVKRLVRETLHDFEGKPVSEIREKIARKLNRGGKEDFVVIGRGDVLQEEEKLERFKVKTFNVIGSGVVKEEGK